MVKFNTPWRFLVRKNQLSPSASFVMSLALALGILVADLTNLNMLSVAHAQTADSGIPVADATVIGSRIFAQDVLIDGVPTSGIIIGSVQVVDAVLLGDTAKAGGVHVNDATNSITGVHVNDLTTSITGVHVNDLTTSITGVHVNDLTTTVTGVHVNDGAYTIIGGIVEGTDVKLVDGVITGSDLRIVGAAVSGSLSGIVVTSTGSTVTPLE
jgi:hypothetical protein